MADSQPNEKAVLALSGAVDTNMTRLRHSIDGLRRIHNRCKDDNGTSINLIAQLTALRSNLGLMHDWLSHAVADMHPQLLSDLDVLMTSCALLVRHLDTLIDRLQHPDHVSLDCATRLKYTVGSRSMDRLRNVAQGQNEAVKLLLAACKCHAMAQRKILLHKSRQIRSRDTSSMKELMRSSKVTGGCMRILTQTSAMIQWLRCLYYIKLLRKQPQHPPTEEDYEIAAANIRSDAIDRALQHDATSLRRETKLVMMGSRNSGKELIMHQMKVLYAEGYYPIEERQPYHYAVRSTARLLIHAIIDLLKDTGIKLPSELNQHFAILLHEVETVVMPQLTQDAVKAVRAIWSCPEFSTLYVQNFEIDFPQYAPYFAQEIERIASDDYVPSEADIMRLDQALGGIRELRFNWDELDVHLFNISGYVPVHFQKRWFHQLEGATALVFTIDVSRYDQPYLGQSSESQLLDDFANFESLAASEKFASSSIILLLNNFTRFREKLPYSPLQTFFSDYVPGEDSDLTARQYILRRFKDVNRNRLSIYSFWVDLDLSDNTHLYAALKKTLQHIQQRKAREEVWNASTTTMGSSSRGLAGRLLASRSDTGSKKRPGTSGSRAFSPLSSSKTE
ncbi:G-protein alpha subunit-domain-containing protein [Phaeosphaeria sp. MPI-PUGE-AT-0046c]|nr:G-protein alpha subunit-domain-containing protein [Phaeosphaeria sp. MPI-PUGE-AT-0046c]